MMTSKITIPVPVDERFFFIIVQKSRIEQNILPRSTIRATQERRYQCLLTDCIKFSIYAWTYKLVLTICLQFAPVVTILN